MHPSAFLLVVDAPTPLTQPAAETKGRTYAELDILFTNKVPARKFAKTKIESLSEGTELAQKEQAGKIGEVPGVQEVGGAV